MVVSLSKLRDFDQSCLPVSKATLYINSLVLYLTEMVHIGQNHLSSEETEFSGNVFCSQNGENYLPYCISLE